MSQYMLRNCVLLALAGAQAWALELPPGTEVQIRLKSKVGSQISRPNDAIEAVVVAPVMAGNVYAIPSGAGLHGVVALAQSSSADQRAFLLVRFTSVDVAGAPVEIAARLAAVDNAREKVDEQGQINGVLAADTAAGKIDAELGKLGDKLGALAGILSTAVLQ
jgi:hypothetical protein